MQRSSVRCNVAQQGNEKVYAPGDRVGTDGKLWEKNKSSEAAIGGGGGRAAPCRAWQ
jgi:hypothetical protein